MAYQDPGKEAQKRVEGLVLAVNNALAAHYQAAKAKLTERITVAISGGAGGKARTPEEQAKFVVQGTSWTCNSSHMSDGAKHVLVSYAGKVVWDLGTLAKQQNKAWAVLEQAWNGAMIAHDLRNYKGGKNFDYPGNDPLHMEIPDSRLPENDPRVVQCLTAYAKATRGGGQAKNVAFETQKGSQFQKDWLIAFDKQAAAAKK